MTTDRLVAPLQSRARPSTSAAKFQKSALSSVAVNAQHRAATAGPCNAALQPSCLAQRAPAGAESGQQNCSSEAPVPTAENLKDDGHLARGRCDSRLDGDARHTGLRRTPAGRSTPPPPPRQPEQPERADLYTCAVLVADGGRLRVIIDRDGRRWLIRRRVPLDRPAPHPWVSGSFCATRAGLKAVAAGLKRRGVTGLAAFIAGLPDRCVSRQGRTVNRSGFAGG